jgi:excisionase family DNA binding protein
MKADTFNSHKSGVASSIAPLGNTVPAALALRTRDAAAALGISERTLQELTATGRVPHVRIGRAVLFPVRELADWLTRQVEAGEPAPPAPQAGGER